MKRNLTLIAAFCLLCCLGAQAQQRYLTSVFNDVTIDTNVTYGHNITMLYKILGAGPGRDLPLQMDVYQPTGDTATVRPLIIYVHTGNFLPVALGPTPINQGATGSRRDSSAVEMCKQFAKRGYVAVSIDYRLGWNAAASGTAGQNIRTGTLLRAVYRAVQDTRTAVRFFKKEAATNGNPLKIDTNKIIIGGQGSGGYVAMAVNSLKDQAGTQISKFLDLSDPLNPVSYVNPDSLGDVYGFGGIADTSNPNGGNIENWAGYSSNAAMAFNLGGALGDSSWMHAGDGSIIAIHSKTDPFAPYKDGNVIVPTTGDFVVAVRGSWTAVNEANNYGNNAYNNRVYSDAISAKADLNNEGVKGIYPLLTATNNDSAPWEWWNQSEPGLPAASNTNGLATNPTMSKAKALRYIDTIQQFLNPRMVVALGLPGEETFPVGINETIVSDVNLSVYPNPASTAFNVVVKDSKYDIQTITLSDVTGKIVRTENAGSGSTRTIQRNGMSAGIYFMNIRFKTGEQANTKVIFE